MKKKLALNNKRPKPMAFIIAILISISAFNSGCSSANDNSPTQTTAPQTVNQFRLPGGWIGDMDCLKQTADEAPPLDVASWMEVSDDFIVGTIAKINPVWTPLWLRETGEGQFIKPADCRDGAPALDIQLVNADSLKNDTHLGEITVRLSGATWPVWGGAWPVAEIGQEITTWGDNEEAPLIEGMQLGGAIYQIDQTSVFMSTREPLFQLIDEKAHFQNILHDGYCNPTQIPTVRAAVEQLDGLSLKEIIQNIKNNDSISDQNVITRYSNESIALHDTELRKRRTAAVCYSAITTPVDVEPTEQECQSTADCEPSQICNTNGACETTP